jgi:hypothetical protein
MRVAMGKDIIPVNCTNFPDGEVEDYTVRISKLPVLTDQSDRYINLSESCSSVLNVKNISSRANYKIYNSAGQVVSRLS